MRQTLQNLRNKGLLIFISKGIYKLTTEEEVSEIPNEKQELVYLLSNDSMPGWVKIGRTSSIKRRLKDLYNTSVPLPFKLEHSILAYNYEQSQILEKSIHNIIDTINPNLRKYTEAKRREFFKLTTEEGKSVFELVSKIIAIRKIHNEQINV